MTMKYTNQRKREIYDRTGGYCHICREKLAFSNYGQHGEKGAWEIDHSVARARGGSDNGNNLYVACTSCNRSKGAATTKSARGKHGHTRAPKSRKARRKAKTVTTWAGAGTGAAIGARVGGIPGAIVGAVIGGVLGSSIKPDH
jgi:5-methylcytosine-specific restriction endonuclease McrA